MSRSRGRTGGAGRWVLALSVITLLVAAPADAQMHKFFVPYHSQLPCNDPVRPNWKYAEPGDGPIPNGFCTCACLDMMFDYWMGGHLGHGTCQPLNAVPAPQLEFAAVANTNDVMNVTGGHRGTYLDDARRAVNFSPTTPAWPSPPPGYVNQNLTGYSWNQLVALPGPAVHFGANAIDGNWTGNGWDRDDFKRLLDQNIPIMINVASDAVNASSPHMDPEDSDADLSGYEEVEDTAIGHSLVVYGYNDALNWFYYHDPTRGACLYEDQDTLWADWWTGKDFLIIEPWNTLMNVDSPSSFVPSWFGVDVMADYADPLPDPGTGLALNPVKGTLGFYAISSADLNAALAQGQPATVVYDSVSQSGDSQWKNWDCVTAGWGDQTSAIAYTYGRVNATSTSFPGGYIDDIGGSCPRQTVDVPRPEASDPSICHVPRSAWWQGAHIGSTPHDYAPGVPNDITAQVENRGILPATDVYVDFYFGDPSLAHFEGDPEMMPFGTTMIPVIYPGEVVETSPVVFAAPGPNTFGQPYFDLFVEAHGGDYPHDIWVEYDNNLACQCVHHAEISPYSGTLLNFSLRNPESEVRTAVVRTETHIPPDWSAQIIPAGMDSIAMGPMEELPLMLAVEAGSEGIGMVDVCEDLYTPSGGFLKRTGGITFLVWTMGTSVQGGDEVTAVSLLPPAPNPSRGGVALSFTLPEIALVDLSIFDVAGRHVATVHRGTAGARRTDLTWDGRDDSGREVASGVYFARLTAGSDVRARKIVLLR
jgi:hypothetical protein